MSDLRVDVGQPLPAQHRRESLHIAVVETCHEHGVQPVQVAGKVPEAGLAREPAVHQHVEAVDAKERRVALSAGEHVQRRMAESDIAHLTTNNTHKVRSYINKLVV